ncbi:DNA-binding protein [Chryseobacterium piperi]|uniref:DNA-binding protein n=1 Tax=Chryseobacterium piperi TaxID=558152 RepID=UPI00068D3A38|nr:DNA-binding protein [Chryseobacterium piperi]ASW73911.1 DNA-binding protein [Chryseobacterium piperi]
MNYTYFFLLLSILIFPHYTWGQVHDYNSTQVDSTTFVQTRMIMNNLSTEKFIKKVFQSDDMELPYRFLIPENFDQNKKYPLVITFHNSVRIGNDNEKQLEPLARIWLRDEIYHHYNGFVLAPQFNSRSSEYVKNNDGLMVSQPSKDLFTLLKLINTIEVEYPSIDKTRIYLVGFYSRSKTIRQIMNISPGTLQNIRVAGKIRFRKVMGSYYYSRTDLLKLFGNDNG